MYRVTIDSKRNPGPLAAAAPARGCQNLVWAAKTYFSNRKYVVTVKVEEKQKFRSAGAGGWGAVAQAKNRLQRDLSWEKVCIRATPPGPWRFFRIVFRNPGFSCVWGCQVPVLLGVCFHCVWAGGSISSLIVGGRCPSLFKVRLFSSLIRSSSATSAVFSG